MRTVSDPEGPPAPNERPPEIRRGLFGYRRSAVQRELEDRAVRGARGEAHEVRARIEEVPDLIREALTPLADAIAGLDGELAAVAGASTPPLMVTPSAIDSGDQEPQEQPRAAGATGE